MSSVVCTCDSKELPWSWKFGKQWKDRKSVRWGSAKWTPVTWRGEDSAVKSSSPLGPPDSAHPGL